MAERSIDMNFFRTRAVLDLTPADRSARLICVAGTDSVGDYDGEVWVQLLRIEHQTSLVADDIRAALTAMGRGDVLAGGIAVIGMAMPESTQPVEAILVLPSSVVLVLGVDLPGPTLHLEAPLYGAWKSDGWSLVGTGNAVNPGSHALVTAEAIARRLHASGEVTVPIRAILAVGPYAETITVPDAEAGGSVRVLHPTPATVRSALVSFTAAERTAVPTCTVEQARAILRAIDSDIPIQPDSLLAREGFVIGTTSAHAAPNATAVVGGVQVPEGLGVDPPHVDAAGSGHARHARTRWLPIAVLCVLLTIVFAAIIMGR